MRAYSLTHLSDAALLRGLASIVSRDCTITAALLAHLAEVDARRLYVPAGYASMHAFCVGELHFSDDAAYKRIQAARAARQHPVLFAAVADGRLHLTAVRLLAPHVTAANVDELVTAATHQRSQDIEAVLARRFAAGVREVPTRVRVLAPASQHAGRIVSAPAPLLDAAAELALGQVQAPQSSAAAPAEERFLLQVAISRSTHDKMRRAQAAVSHSVRAGDIATVLDQSFEALLEKCAKRKVATTVKPRAPRSRPAKGKRTIPADVRRAVWARDEGRCTFVGANGHRCGTRTLLEFDHVDPVARGGQATPVGMRLRCRAHNQYEAERAFGREFMEEKRQRPVSVRPVPGDRQRILPRVHGQLKGSTARAL